MTRNDLRPTAGTGSGADTGAARDARTARAVRTTRENRRGAPRCLGGN